MTYHQWIKQCKRDYIAQVLLKAKGNRTKAAKFAGVNRQYFYRLLRRHNFPVLAVRRGNDAWRQLDS